MAFGLTALGFSIKTLEDIRADISATLRSYYGPSLDLDTGILGRLVGIVSERYAELWELAQAVAASTDPDQAKDDQLAALCLLTGAFRLEPVASKVTLTCTGTVSATIPIGSRVATASTAREFKTQAAATLLAPGTWAISTVYAVGARRTNAGRVYVCTTAGASAASGGPTTTALDITDNVAHWRYLGEGVAVADVAAEATLTGPTVAVSGDITAIVTPAGGWSSVVNLLDATIGYDVQQDEALRITREAELSQSGGGVPDAIRAALLSVAGVTSATVFNNPTDYVDVDGMLPHSVEALVRGGDDSDIGKILLDQVPAGTATNGAVITFPVDSEGTLQIMKHSRPVEINVRVIVNVIKNPKTFPTDGVAQIQAAIALFGNAQAGGKNAVAWSIGAQCLNVVGVIDVTSCLISSATFPTVPGVPVASTTITIALRELGRFDTSMITVNTTDGTP